MMIENYTDIEAGWNWSYKIFYGYVCFYVNGKLWDEIWIDQFTKFYKKAISSTNSDYPGYILCVKILRDELIDIGLIDE